MDEEVLLDLGTGPTKLILGETYSFGTTIRTILYSAGFDDHTPVWTPLFVVAEQRGFPHVVLRMRNGKAERLFESPYEFDAIAHDVGIELTETERGLLDGYPGFTLWGVGSADAPWGTTAQTESDVARRKDDATMGRPPYLGLE